jgi:uncharacterized protein YyaL (SSP411 family)
VAGDGQLVLSDRRRGDPRPQGKNILKFVGEMDQRPALAEARRKLFKARAKQVHPGRDKVQLAPERQLTSNAADRVGCIAIVDDPYTPLCRS